MDSKLEQDFFQYLSNLGFPKASIIYEPAFQPIGDGRRYRPDFALLDPNTNEPLAVIEITSGFSQDNILRAAHQIQRYITALRDKAVRGFVVTTGKSGEGFYFYTLGENGEPKQVPSASFLDFESLSSARIAEKKEMLAEEKKETADQFTVICFAAATFAISVVTADFICSRYGITLLTTERMALIGTAIALVVVPYVQKFKGLGIEIDRATKQTKA